MLEMFIYAASAFLTFSFIHYASKKKKPFKRAFLSMMTGLLALTAVNLLSGYSGVYIPVTKLSLLLSLIGGVPGVALMTLLTVF